MSDYGIVNYGTDRFEVLADGHRVAVFDHENDAKIFVSMKKARIGRLVKAAEMTVKAIRFSLAFDGIDDECRMALQNALDANRAALSPLQQEATE